MKYVMYACTYISQVRGQTSTLSLFKILYQIPTSIHLITTPVHPTVSKQQAQAPFGISIRPATIYTKDPQRCCSIYPSVGYMDNLAPWIQQPRTNGCTIT
ncbi:unnamed protein product [Meganyctiphanes norvegica]|uniref:Uncharacterized protein n=1 Tax=Meganyctiphanes norvegica TaxID=48144 RepID=A0AAV2Q989_MEGNR